MPDGYAANWFAVLLVAVVGVAAVGAMFLANRIIAPRRPSDVKNSPYECGIEAAPFRWSQIHIRYYVFAILFIVFDVEAVFLFPWALVFLQAETYVFYAMMLFIGVLLFGLGYAWRKGVLDWR